MSRFILPDSFANLPSAVKKIQKLFTQESVSSEALARLLEKEPLLCANILMLVNSPHYGLSRKITSIQHALMLLGTTIIRGIIMATVLKKAFPINLDPYAITLDAFDKICITRSRLLALWMRGEALDLATLSSAAFLMESGKIIMANEIVKHNSTQEFRLHLKNATPREAERIFFETSSYAVAAKLFAQWLFSEEFTTLIAGVEEPRTREQKILNALISLVNTEEIMSESSIAFALEKAKEFGLNEIKLSNAIEKIQKEL